VKSVAVVRGSDGAGVAD